MSGFFRWVGCLLHGHSWDNTWPGMTREEFVAPYRDCTVCGHRIHFHVYEIRDAGSQR